MMLLVLTLSTAFSIWSGQESPKQDTCTHEQLLHNKLGKPVQLSEKETRKRITHCESVKLPGLIDAQGVVLVKVLIDPEGKVLCSIPISGHPLLKKFASDAVNKWQFKPIEKAGKRVAVYGLVSVHVS